MKWRKIKYILFHRSVLAGLALVAQVAVLFVMVNEFTAHFDYFYWFCIFVSFLATVSLSPSPPGGGCSAKPVTTFSPTPGSVSSPVCASR